MTIVKTSKGKWRVKNGEVLEIRADDFGYYAHWREDIFYYDLEGRMIRDIRRETNQDICRSSWPEDSVFSNWDLVELVEPKVIIEVIESKPVRRINNAILLGLCTEY